MSDGAEYVPTAQFFDESPSFALGFEAGLAYSQMRDGPGAPFDTAVHDDNAGQLLHFAKQLGWRVRFEPLSDRWLTMFAERAP